MGFVEDSLIKGEAVVYRATIHWGVFVPAISLLGLSVVLLFFGKDPRFLIGSIVGFAIACGVAGEGAIKFFCTELAVTNRRVIGKTGLVSRHSVDIMLGKIEGIAVEQGILGRIFDFGTIVVSGTGTSRNLFPGIKAPLDCRRAIQDSV